ncbi:MAG: ATP-dependent DNA helicase RecG [Alphaproteobacteria bacterium]|nr:MAG: ATP-dependent DNA helicase RecG [Alphaproteobacteria bacterium]
MSQRPFDLDPLFLSISTLPGVGSRISKLMEKLIEGPKILDLLFHAPVDFIDRRFSCPISDCPNGKVVTMEVRIEKHFPSARKSLPYRVKATDDSGAISLVFFHANKGWIEKLLPIGKAVVISGKIEHFQGQPQMMHPDIAAPDERETLETVEAIYPLTQGVTNKVTRKAVTAALTHIPVLPEWLNDAHKKREKWGDWHTCLQALHTPMSDDALDPMHDTRMRLAYDELLANQLTLALVRDRQRKINGRAFPATMTLRDKVMAVIPFELTGAQKRSLAEIDSDMAEPARMLRLLQGDVGSGKTVVACLAMLSAIENNTQAAIMAPTEILARQHAETFKDWLDTAGIRFVTLTGRDKGKSRDLILKQIKDGTAQVIIGTHAIFQKDVEYKDLGLAVIDEQHKFGVHQRLELSNKNKGTDILVMTATPIPRTLALTAYGDMEVSKLDEKPPGRKPIDTMLFSNDKLDQVVAGIKRKIVEGVRVYWVCPLVEESETLDLAAAEERYDILKATFGERIGLIHGRLKPAEKDAVMEKFANGALDILIATTVIEVGVNIPEATIMVIEHAERFGLSQLHQLRGRVGRGAEKSYCFLIYSAPLGETAKERLNIMRDTEDGFIIAEKDLELRGSGNILGTKQSGMTEFRLANLAAHGDLLAAARDDAKLIIAKDPKLETERGKALKTLLYLFECDQAIQYFRGG